MSIKPLKISSILINITPGVPVSNVNQTLVRFCFRAKISSSNSVWVYFKSGCPVFFSSSFARSLLAALICFWANFSYSFSFSLSFLWLSLFSFRSLWASSCFCIIAWTSNYWCVFSRASFKILKQSLTLRFSLSPAQVIMKPVIPSLNSFVFLLWA